MTTNTPIPALQETHTALVETIKTIGFSHLSRSDQRYLRAVVHRLEVKLDQAYLRQQEHLQTLAELQANLNKSSQQAA